MSDLFPSDVFSSYMNQLLRVPSLQAVEVINICRNHGFGCEKLEINDKIYWCNYKADKLKSGKVIKIIEQKDRHGIYYQLRYQVIIDVGYRVFTDSIAVSKNYKKALYYRYITNYKKDSNLLTKILLE